MAATEQVLSSLARLGNIGLGGVDSPENRPSEQDSALFSALLEESGSGNRPPEEKTASREREDDGNDLPALPLAVPVPPPVAERVPEKKADAADSDLEDFAVRLGIDRSLARLLLDQTAGAPAADATMAPVATPDVAGFAAVFQNSMPADSANRPKAGIASAGGPKVDEPITGSPAGLDSADFTASLIAAAASSIAKPSLPEATPDIPASAPGTESKPPLSQLDIARLVGVDAKVEVSIQASTTTSASAAPRSAPSPTVSPPLLVPPALNAAPETVTLIAAAPLGDEDLLRWRSIAARADSSVTEEIPADDTISNLPFEIAPEDKVRTAIKDPAPRAGHARDASGHGARAGSDELLAISSLRTFALEQSGAAAPLASPFVDGGLTVPAPLTGVTTFDPNAPMAGVTLDTGTTSSVTQSGSSGGVMNEPLRMPEPKFDFAMRAEMFADQVAQRVLGQIRNQAYDVSLQIDPRNLGPMDISLRVDGAHVAASVAVTHPEVRSLLESGLPRLRESLESAGLSLTNWSFAQSSSRDPSGTRQRGGSAAGEMRRVARVADEADDGRAVSAISSGSNRAVDLFV